MDGISMSCRWRVIASGHNVENFNLMKLARPKAVDKTMPKPHENFLISTHENDTIPLWPRHAEWPERCGAHDYPNIAPAKLLHTGI